MVLLGTIVQQVSLLASSLYHSANTSLIFVHIRNWVTVLESAAIQQTKTSGLLSLFVNFKNNYKSIYLL